MELVITDEATLLTACDVVHDGEFDLDSVAFDSATGAWRISLRRVDFTSQSVVRDGLLFERVAAPVYHSVLSLEGVLRFEVNDRSRIGVHSFDGCRRVSDGYEFVFHTDMEFVIVFAQGPTGSLRDVGPSQEQETWRRFRSRKLTSAST